MTNRHRQTARLDVHGLSIRGERHDDNHDHFAIATLNKSLRLHQTNLSIDDDSRVHGDSHGHLFVVADGISAGPAPARASKAAVDGVVRYFLNEMPWHELGRRDSPEVPDALERALERAQDELRELAGGWREGMGTTMTLAFVFWPHLYVVHAGDSRCYLSRKGALRRLTTDHTIGELSRRFGRRATRRSARVLWNAVGGRGTELSPELRYERLELGDVLALVSDGVVPKGGGHRKLEKVLGASRGAEAMCASVVERAGPDDRTAVIVRFLPHESVEATPQVASPGDAAERSSDEACATVQRARIRPEPVVRAG